MDLGDQYHYFCVLDDAGSVIEEGRIRSTLEALKRLFGERARTRVALEAGTHSPWISRALASWGHEVLVGNPRKLRLIWARADKSDVSDAQMLARLARFDRELLCPIHHRGERSQSDLAFLQARDHLVKARTKLINHCRSTAKSLGLRLPSSTTSAFSRMMQDAIPEPLQAALAPLVATIGELTEKIHQMDRGIERLCAKDYPETQRLRKISGVGAITSLGFVLTLEQSERFAKSRSVGPFLGLTPRRDQSGDVDKHLRISKTGDKYLRRLLVSSSQYILGPFGPDCDLRRFGLRLCERGGKTAKKRAVVAVARKLAVLLHRLWASNEPYDPFCSSRRSGEVCPEQAA